MFSGLPGFQALKSILNIWTRVSGGLVAIQLFGIFGPTMFLYKIRGVGLTVQRI